MGKEVMRRRAADNPYLHKDFHGALSVGLDYLAEHYGPQAVKDYLRRFARTFYAPLIADLKKRGLAALKDHFTRVYQIEGGQPRFTLSRDELRIEVEACPAVTHMRAHGYPVSPHWVETTRTVNEALCEGTAYAAELRDYDPETGRCVQRFYRRPS